ncbi:hypothetical protein L6164_016730 [Bauhinia variegata]|uniref:Uncharacterized protein n=1 Tax=Bauhinia variegata TaxID=167791 RepID=A0ACB9N6S9_BAUVA|nr:hypothetical protein L6164_016730 [Bauhinia variegata]
MIIEKLSGCEIKGNPHIQSRLKTLKNSWQAVYDIVQGSHTSGFGWDKETNIVIADKAIWDEYLKVYKKTAPFRSQPFPHFDALCIVWTNDRAIGKDAQSADDINEEANRVNFEEGHDNVSEHQFAYDYENDDTLSEVPKTPRTRSNSGSRKKSKNDIVIMDERKEKLFEDLLKVQGLTPNEIYGAHIKLAQDSNLLVVFPIILELFKADWIHRLI